MTETAFPPLKLLATTAEDISIISTQLQDSLLSLSSIHFDQENNRLTCLINRFCWEQSENYNQFGAYYRVHTGACFHSIENVHLKGFTQDSEHRMFNILALSLDDQNHLRILGTHGYEIRLNFKELYCQFADLEAPWPTQKKPKHIYQHLE
jgi:hypothetical protein